MLIGLTGTGSKNALARMAVEYGYLVCDFNSPVRHAAAEALGLPLDFFTDEWKRDQHNLRLGSTPAQAEAKFIKVMTEAFGADWRLHLWMSYVVDMLEIEGTRIALPVDGVSEAEAVRRMGGQLVDAAGWRETVPH